MPTLLGCAAIGALTLIGVRLQSHLAITAFLYLIVIVLVSVRAGLLGSLLVSGLALLLLHVVFVMPLRVQPEFDLTILAASGVTPLVITDKPSRVRESFRPV